MHLVVNFSAKKPELDLLETALRDEIAYMSDEDWEIQSHISLAKYVESLLNTDFVDISCLDVTENGAIYEAEKLRSKSPDVMLVIIADVSTPPTLYLRPGIMASSLILRPIRQTDLKLSFNELMAAYLKRNEEKERDEETFCVDFKDEKRYIPYKNIFYFEAREKKIYLNTKDREYGFYSTLEELEKSLPDYFVRSHRGFILNSRKVERIVSAQKMIFMENNIIVPLSRGYKNSFKEALGGTCCER